jgi:hypothetical protein
LTLGPGYYQKREDCSLVHSGDPRCGANAHPFE